MNKMSPVDTAQNDLCVFLGLNNEFPDLDLYTAP